MSADAITIQCPVPIARRVRRSITAVEPTRILVVEDDDLVCAFLCRALSGVAEVVDACASGSAALSAVQQRRYDVILLDGLLPDIHGIDLAREMLGRPTTGRTGICVVSGTLRHAQSMISGISALPKPLRVRELTDAVELLLAWRRNPTGTLADRVDAIDVLHAGVLVG